MRPVLRKAVRILGGVLVAIIALVAIIWGVGSAMPVPHSVSRSIVLHQKPDAVWHVITDHANDPQWRPDVVSVTPVPVTRSGDRNGHPIWEEQYQDGERMWLETLASEPPRRLVRRIAEGQVFGGTWTYELTPSADGNATTLKITEDGEIYNPAFRFLGKYVFGHATTLEKYQAALAKKFKQ
jgi:uncharacterized protein YndB with AHSA1/START domain